MFVYIIQKPKLGKKPRRFCLGSLLDKRHVCMFGKHRGWRAIVPNSSCPLDTVSIPSPCGNKFMPLFQNPWHHIAWAMWRQINDHSMIHPKTIHNFSKCTSFSHTNMAPCELKYFHVFPKFKQARRWTEVSTWKEIPTFHRMLRGIHKWRILKRRSPNALDAPFTHLDFDGDWPLVGHNPWKCLGLQNHGEEE